MLSGCCGFQSPFSFSGCVGLSQSSFPTEAELIGNCKPQENLMPVFNLYPLNLCGLTYLLNLKCIVEQLSEET